ncbi:hypothetical protein Tco_0805752 [Tanacetum coccineum]
MDVLESCPKHNMVAYLEKTEGNAEFHEIIDFLAQSSIHHALTIKSEVDLFLMMFDGLGLLPNQAIFDSIQLIGESTTLFASMFGTNQLRMRVACQKGHSKATTTPLSSHPRSLMGSRSFRIQAKEIQTLEGTVSRSSRSKQTVIHTTWSMDESVSLKQDWPRKEP